MRLPELSMAHFALYSFLILIYLVLQQHVIPKYTEKSHYQALGVKPDATIHEIVHAYEKLSSSRTCKHEDKNCDTTDNVQIQHAYEILSDPYRRRDYDNFHLDELKETAKTWNASSKLQKLPLWEPFNYEPLNLVIYSLTTESFGEIFSGTEPWLIQIYSVASRECWNHEIDLVQIYEQMDGVAQFGRVELGDSRLASYFADKNSASGAYFFRQGLPVYAAFPSDCRDYSCFSRFTGKITVDGVVDWMATQVLQLPRIMYYSPRTLVTDLFQKSEPHKVKVVIFSTTGERAAPFFRKAANDFWDYAVFGLVLWREENATLWENMLGLQSAPALLILRDPGLMPTIFHGKINSSMLDGLLEANKNHVLPQLRSVTAQELGCSEAGYSLAGQSIHNWYCVIVAGRPSLELNQARAVLRDVKDNLTKESYIKHTQDSPAVLAFKENRLTLAWLDGSVQKEVCYFYLNSENVHESCGAKRFREQVDMPRVFIIRYRRHPKDREKFRPKKNHASNIWQKLLEANEEDLASQIVAKYDGSLHAHNIITWVSMMIKEGDTQDLLFYMKRAPPLLPEESKPIWARAAKSFASSRSGKILGSSRRFFFAMSDYLKDPRFSSTVVLVLVMYGSGLLLSLKQGRR